MGVPLSKIGYAGTKDKHAVTYQYVTVPQQYKLPERIGMSYFKFEGYLRDRITIGDLEGNNFEVTSPNPKRILSFIQNPRIVTVSPS